MKFLVMWRIELLRISPEVVRAVARMPEYAQPLMDRGKVLARYHIVGTHGGAWIFEVESHEELELLLAGMPTYNVSTFDVYPLADMAAPPIVGS